MCIPHTTQTADAKDEYGGSWELNVVHEFGSRRFVSLFPSLACAASQTTLFGIMLQKHTPWGRLILALAAHALETAMLLLTVSVTEKEKSFRGKPPVEVDCCCDCCCVTHLSFFGGERLLQPRERTTHFQRLNSMLQAFPPSLC